MTNLVEFLSYAGAAVVSFFFFMGVVRFYHGKELFWEGLEVNIFCSAFFSFLWPVTVPLVLGLFLLGYSSKYLAKAIRKMKKPKNIIPIFATCLLLASGLRAEKWQKLEVQTTVRLSPVDELLLNKYPAFGSVNPKTKLYKLSHPDVKTVKVYVCGDSVVYAVWKWKPMPSHWEFVDSKLGIKLAEMQALFDKGIPEEMTDAKFLLGEPEVGNYDGRFNKRIPPAIRSRPENVKVAQKGFAKFDSDDINGMNAFHMAHTVKFATFSPWGESSGDVYLFYDDGPIAQVQSHNYEVPNE